MFWLCFFVCLSVFTINVKVVIGSLSIFFRQLGLVKEPNTLWKDPVHIKGKKNNFQKIPVNTHKSDNVVELSHSNLALNGI